MSTLNHIHKTQGHITCNTLKNRATWHKSSLSDLHLRCHQFQIIAAEVTYGFCQLLQTIKKYLEIDHNILSHFPTLIIHPVKFSEANLKTTK